MTLKVTCECEAPLQKLQRLLNTSAYDLFGLSGKEEMSAKEELELELTAKNIGENKWFNEILD